MLGQKLLVTMFIDQKRGRYRLALQQSSRLPIQVMLKLDVGETNKQLVDSV